MCCLSTANLAESTMASSKDSLSRKFDQK